MKNSIRIAALLAAAMLLAACGGEGGGDAAAPTDPAPSGSQPPAGPPSTPPPATPPQAPSVSAEQALIQKMVGTMLLIEATGKSSVKDIPATYADAITAHGPSPVCDSSCDSYAPENWWTLVLDDGSSVRVIQWQDLDIDGVFDPLSEQLVFDFDNVGAMTGTVQVLRSQSSPDVYNLMLGAKYDAQDDYGARLGASDSLRFSGALMGRTVSAGRLRIGDYDLVPSASRTIVLHEMDAQAVAHTAVLDTKLTLDTNSADRDSIVATFDWDRFGEDINQSFQTLTALNFTESSGVLQLEGGSFLITTTDHGAKTALRVSVDADPAFLRVEIDAGADGSYESVQRIAQSDVDYRLP